MNDQITVEQFRRAFFSRLYSNEFSNASAEIDVMLRTMMVELLAMGGNDISLRYKRYSSIHDVKVKIVAQGPMFNVVPCTSQLVPGGFKTGELIVLSSTPPMLRFYSNAIPSLEQAKKKLAASVKLNGTSFKLAVDDLANDIALTKILTYAEESVKIFNFKRQEYISKLCDVFQSKFQEETRLNFDDIAVIYFDYTPAKFYSYFVDNGFSGLQTLYDAGFSKFPQKSQKDFVSYPSSFPMNGWETSRKPDGYGHECGSAVEIDWTNRKLSTYGWSSDD